MSILVIVMLIILGIMLFIVEFLVIPGITIAGIGGAILLVGGVILGYHYHGPVVGNYILLGTALASILSLYLALKSRTWRKAALETQISSKINIISPGEDKVKTGDTGITITRLNPMGKIEMHGEFYEGKAIDSYLDPGTEIIVIKVEKNKLIVKPKNT